MTVTLSVPLLQRFIAWVADRLQSLGHRHEEDESDGESYNARALLNFDLAADPTPLEPSAARESRRWLSSDKESIRRLKLRDLSTDAIANAILEDALVQHFAFLHDQILAQAKGLRPRLLVTTIVLTHPNFLCHGE